MEITLKQQQQQQATKNDSTGTGRSSQTTTSMSEPVQKPTRPRAPSLQLDPMREMVIDEVVGELQQALQGNSYPGVSVRL
jgi:hypothetical protein